MKTKLKFGEISIEVTQKNIKNIHLSVNPDGNVRVSAPIESKIDSIRSFALSRLSWIKQQQKKYAGQERSSPPEFVNRESHYIWGTRYMLHISESDIRLPFIELNGNKLIVNVKLETPEDKIQVFVEQWYRDNLRLEVLAIIEKWKPILDVNVDTVFIQKMKTKWGGCNTESSSLRLNAELIKKPRELVEYIVVHEMVHLIERSHNDTFFSLMDKYIPMWRQLKQQLNQSTLPDLDQNI